VLEELTPTVRASGHGVESAADLITFASRRPQCKMNGLLQRSSNNDFLALPRTSERSNGTQRDVLPAGNMRKVVVDMLEVIVVIVMMELIFNEEHSNSIF